MSVSVDSKVSDDGVVCLAVAGEVDLDSADVLRAAIDEALAGEAGVALVVDLDHVTFLDSTGIAVLVAGRHAAAERGWVLRVVNPRGMVRRVLEITGVLPSLEVGERPGEAGERPGEGEPMTGQGEPTTA
jgi:anti-sigma B factor antagonist